MINKKFRKCILGLIELPISKFNNKKYNCKSCDSLNSQKINKKNKIE